MQETIVHFDLMQSKFLLKLVILGIRINEINRIILSFSPFPVSKFLSKQRKRKAAGKPTGASK